MKTKGFAVVLLSVCSLFSTAVAAMNGSGNENDPYVISTPQDLKEFSDLVNGGENSAHAVLENDIDISGYSPWPRIADDSDTIYQGTFDGQGHKITGYSTKTEANDSGLFGYNKGKIKNVVLYGSGSIGICFDNREHGEIIGCKNYAEISSDESHSAAISVYNGGIIDSCENNGKVTASIKTNRDGNDVVVGYTQYDIAGICLFNDGVIKNCINSGEIYAPGITVDNGEYFQRANAVGICYGSGDVIDCKNYGMVTGWDDVCGITYGSTAERCINFGRIEHFSTNGSNAGGISCQSKRIIDCINYGDVINHGTDHWATAGGICASFGGFNDYNWATMIGCINYGKVQGYLRVGGVCGSISDYTEIYGSYYVEGTLIEPSVELRPEDYQVCKSELEISLDELKKPETAYIMNTGRNRENAGVWAAGGVFATDDNKAVYKVKIRKTGTESEYYTSPDGRVAVLDGDMVYRKDTGGYIWTDTVITEDMTVEEKEFWIENLTVKNKYGDEYVTDGIMTASVDYVAGDKERGIIFAFGEYFGNDLLELDADIKHKSGRNVQNAEFKVDVQYVWIGEGTPESGNGYYTLSDSGVKFLIMDEDLNPLTDMYSLRY